MALVARVGQVTCALPIEGVVETMRPLPVEPIGQVPPYIRGVTILRGRATVVIDMAHLLGQTASAEPTRFVVVRAGERRVALAFEEVIDVRAIRAELGPLPPLLRAVAPEAVTAIGAANSAIVVLLETAHVVPPELLREIGARA
jgi:purine-binding chemotaxis protein CheW